MADHFIPQSLTSLLKEVISDLNSESSVLGLPYSQIFNPNEHPNLQISRYGSKIATPFGLAAGPHTQLARNIISGWLMGARYIELKTIQTLDELNISKPCIDMQDEGYNCEWSQELKVEESFHEYLNAWIIIHIVSHKMGWGFNPETIFNMSVGYNMEGILNANVQWFLQKMSYCPDELNEKLQQIKNIYPQVLDLQIPAKISNNITLSTMHGCPPEEIEEISAYLIIEKKLHTTVKLNPTLLGKDQLRFILNENASFPIEVPDGAFEHDIDFPDAVEIIKRLGELSYSTGLHFAVKLTNTLEVNNRRGALPEEMLYMSGRALHPISVNLAYKLQKEFDGKLDISFSGGVDAFNLVSIIKSGLFPVTVSSDLLKPGGYGRLFQYSQNIAQYFRDQHILNKKDEPNIISNFHFLEKYSRQVLEDKKYKYSIWESKNIKSTRSLNKFDCISAPCMDACPTEQDIPEYLYWASKGDFDQALEVIYSKNPLPRTLGLVCEHGCQTKCTRINYDDTLRIRDIKEFIARNGNSSLLNLKPSNGLKVAIIGAGPSGLSAAWFLALEGTEVEIFEKNDQAGGVPKKIIPHFRLDGEALQFDIDRILNIGVKISYNQTIKKDDLEKLTQEFDYVYLAGGAGHGKLLNIPGENLPIVKDPLEILSLYKTQNISHLGENIVIIGGGNTAMDIARTAKRIQKSGKVSIVYRRTMQQMPAEPQEIRDAITEGIEILELLSPTELIEHEGVFTLRLQKMQLSNKIGKDGRKDIQPMDSEFVDLPIDCLIPAIGQERTILSSMANHVDDLSNYDSKIKIYAGGDASRGASSIVQAAADGRFFANHILKIEDLFISTTVNENHRNHINKLHERQSLRVQSNYPFDLSNVAIQEVIQESSRCLQCDHFCSICVSVCPNRANITYDVQPQNYHYQNITTDKNLFSLSEPIIFSLNQKSQVFNIGDFCNECGNCATFCPSVGSPYLDKPQVHLSRKSFEESSRGYLFEAGVIYGKLGSENFQMHSEGGKYYYEDSKVEVLLTEETLKILDVYIKDEGNYLIDLSCIVEMKILKDFVFERDEN